MPELTEFERDMKLRNELADSSALIDYAIQLLKVQTPRMTSVAGQVRLGEMRQSILSVFPAERAAE